MPQRISLQTTELIKNHLLLLDSPWGGETQNCPLLQIPDTRNLHMCVYKQTQDSRHAGFPSRMLL